MTSLNRLRAGSSAGSDRLFLEVMAVFWSKIKSINRAQLSDHAGRWFLEKGRRSPNACRTMPSINSPSETSKYSGPLQHFEQALFDAHSGLNSLDCYHSTKVP